MAKKKTRDRILDTTLALIGKEGAAKITVRRISTQAKVNVAAINYYFGSKEELVEEVLRKLREQMDQHFVILDQEDLDCRERLFRFGTAIMGFLMDYPGISLIMFKASMQNSSQPHHLMQNELERQQKVLSLIARCTGIEDPLLLSIKSAILYSSILHPIFSHKPKPSQHSTVDFTDSGFRENYVRILIDGIVKAGQ